MGAECVNACAVCCAETIEEINARAKNVLQLQSLTLANVLCVLLLGAHVYFEVIGKELNLPYEFYIIMLSPYGGAALQKIVAKLKNGKK